MNGPVEIDADQFFKHFSASRVRDVKQGEQRRGDAPDPVLLAVVLEARFIASKCRLADVLPPEDFLACSKKGSMAAWTSLTSPWLPWPMRVRVEVRVASAP